MKLYVETDLEDLDSCLGVPKEFTNILVSELKKEIEKCTEGKEYSIAHVVKNVSLICDNQQQLAYAMLIAGRVIEDYYQQKMKQEILSKLLSD